MRSYWEFRCCYQWRCLLISLSSFLQKSPVVRRGRSHAIAPVSTDCFFADYGFGVTVVGVRIGVLEGAVVAVAAAVVADGAATAVATGLTLTVT